MRRRVPILFVGACVALSTASVSYYNFSKKNVHVWKDPVDEIGAHALKSFYESNFREAKRLFAKIYAQLHTNSEAISADSRWSHPMAKWNLLRTLMQIERELNPSNLQIAQYLILSSSAFVAENSNSEQFSTLLADSCMVAADILHRKQKIQEARSYLDLGLSFLTPVLNSLVSSTTAESPKDILKRHVELCNSISSLLETSGENYLLDGNWLNGYDHFRQSYALLAQMDPNSAAGDDDKSIFEKLQLDPASRRSILFYNMATCLVGLSRFSEAKAYCETVRSLLANNHERSAMDTLKRLIFPMNLIEKTKDENISLLNRYKDMNMLLLGHINMAMESSETAIDLFSEVLRNTSEADLRREAHSYMRKLKK
ncbi:hypothetical protein MDAP_000418 [Mitosporidium daphniae]|uniref:Uncharacterized protein n=1 Tax=Mitosporidium daphniae TaxID=1485682 RepID=A0A098VUM3_9MICR|nr:uncharacterized protein DI09_149p30 [Mitosporidium daphniae]KGG52655.1 hypothetical protein DI09_149p30 [Mitosporidium daphniae]|eukprot:XP_013239091.1 uncharacterized protein DI09_149p30 [Mitosporidium daphniae]